MGELSKILTPALKTELVGRAVPVSKRRLKPETVARRQQELGDSAWFDRECLVTQIAEWGVFVWHGGRTPEEVRAIYRKAARSYYELLQALDFKLPVEKLWSARSAEEGKQYFGKRFVRMKRDRYGQTYAVYLAKLAPSDYDAECALTCAMIAQDWSLADSLAKEIPVPLSATARVMAGPARSRRRCWSGPDRTIPMPGGGWSGCMARWSSAGVACRRSSPATRPTWSRRCSGRWCRACPRFAGIVPGTAFAAIYFGKHEVTIGQFRHFVDATGYVTDALAFCRWLSEREWRPYRLPTDAEWEYACRAGTTTPWSCGGDPHQLRDVANVGDASTVATRPRDPFHHRLAPWDDGYPMTAPVGSFEANGFGLCDMHGNAAELCGNELQQYLRGAGWGRYWPLELSAPYRGGPQPPDARWCDGGFRVVWDAFREPLSPESEVRIDRRVAAEPEVSQAEAEAGQGQTPKEQPSSPTPRTKQSTGTASGGNWGVRPVNRTVAAARPS